MRLESSTVNTESHLTLNHSATWKCCTEVYSLLMEVLLWSNWFAAVGRSHWEDKKKTHCLYSLRSHLGDRNRSSEQRTWSSPSNRLPIHFSGLFHTSFLVTIYLLLDRQSNGEEKDGMERERWKASSHRVISPKRATTVRDGQGQKLHQGIPCGCHEPKHLDCHPSPPRYISREVNWK